MNRRFQRLQLFFALLLVFLLGVSATGFAQDAQPELLQFTPDESVLAQEGIDRTIIEDAARMEDGRLLVYIELQAEPAAVTYARSGGENGGATADAMKSSQSQIVQSEQFSFLSNIAAAGINLQVLEQTDTVINTLMVAIADSDVAVLRARPDVRNVYPVALFEREHQTSVPFIGAPAAWDGTFGGAYTGQGVVIGIIDSGIDYSHRNFGGDGTWPTDPNLRNAVGGVGDETNYPGPKVVGGWDYVGDLYNGGSTAGGATNVPAVDLPTPDADPIDCTTIPADLAATFGVVPNAVATGHGSHVAGTAAGYGVNMDGTTYTSGYAAVNFGAMRIGPGVAPEAQLVALRVFGCYGATGFALAALDDAVAGTHSPVVDVVNMSLGSHTGSNGDDPFLNPYIVAIQNATAAGTLVVMSTGNSSDTHFISGSPGSTPAGIAVASVSDGDFPQITVAGTTANGNYAVRNSIGAPPNAIVGPYGITIPTGVGCTAANYANWPANRIAMVTFTGVCGSVGLMAAAGGATPNKPLGLLVVSNSPGDFQNLSCTAVTPYIPCVSITSTLGDLLAANIATATVTFNPNLQGIDATFADAISSFSSRGVGRDGENGIKPDLSGPGGSILSTRSGTGTLGQVLGGTSMSAPHVAGVAALLMSNPTYASWTTLQIKALMMNTANNDVTFNVTGSPRVGPQRMGTGRVDVVDAFSNQVIAYNTYRPDVVSVSFGNVEYMPGVMSTLTKDVTIANRSAVSVTYNLSIDTITDANGAVFTVSPSSITVAPMDSEDVTVTLTMNMPATGVQPHNRSDVTQQTAQPNAAGTLLARFWITEEGALLELTPTAGATTPLRLSLYAALDAASEMHASSTEVDVSGETGSGSVGLSGTGVNTGAALPFDVQSLVSAYQLTGVDAVGDGDYIGLPEADLQYVGVASNFDQAGGNTAGSANSSTLVSFAITTAAEWDTLNELSFRIYVDTLGNGFGSQVDNFISFSQSTTSNATVSDIFNNFWRYSGSGSGFGHGFPNWFSPTQIETNLYHNNVIVLPMLPGATASYGGGNTRILPVGDTDFNFYVETFHRSWGVVDTTPIMYYDLANPIIDTVPDGAGVSALPAVNDLPGNSINFDYDVSNWQAGDPTPQLLLIHHHNEESVQNADGANFRRAETVRLDFDTADLAVEINATPVDPDFWYSRDVGVDVSVENLGNDPAVPDIFVDLPDSVSYIGGDAVCTHSGEPVGGSVECDFPNYLLSGFMLSAHFDLNVDPNFVGLLTLTATTADEGSIVDPDWSNNTDTDTVPVPPMPPTPQAPIGDVFTGNPTFEWDPVVGGQWYELRILTNNGGTPVEFFSQWYDSGLVCAGNDCAVTPTLNLPTGSYLYYIRSWHAQGGYSVWSIPTVFTVATQTPTPTPINPMGSTTSTNPAFQWTDAPGADEYYLWVDMTSGPGGGTHIADMWFDDAVICDGYNCFADLGLSLMGGQYTWWVQAWSDTGGYSVWSVGTNFTVAIPPVTPTPYTPMGAVSGNTPFTWASDSTAEWHYLWIAGEDGTVWNQWYQDSVICDMSSICTVNLPFVLNTGYYVWWVQSYSSFGGFSAWTAGTNFTVNTPPAAPTQVAPNGSLNPGDVPTFIFNPVAGADWYYVWVSGPNGHVLDMWFSDSICAGGFCTAMTGVAMNDIGAYRWWVQAWGPAGGYSVWSGPMNYSVNAPIPDEGEEPEAPVVPDIPTPEGTVEGS